MEYRAWKQDGQSTLNELAFLTTQLSGFVTNIAELLLGEDQRFNWVGQLHSKEQAHFIRIAGPPQLLSSQQSHLTSWKQRSIWQGSPRPKTDYNDSSKFYSCINKKLTRLWESWNQLLSNSAGKLAQSYGLKHPVFLPGFTMTLFLFLPLVLEEHNILRVRAHRSRQGQDTRLSSTLLNLSALALAPLVVLFDMWHRVSTWHRLNRCVYILAANHRTLVLNSRRTIRIARSERHKRTRFQMQFWKRICKRYYLLSVKLYGVNNCFDLPVRRRISFCAIHWKSCGRAEIVMIYGTVIQLRDLSSVWVDKHLSATWHSLWEIVGQFISIQRIRCIELTKSLSVKKFTLNSRVLYSRKHSKLSFQRVLLMKTLPRLSHKILIASIFYCRPMISNVQSNFYEQKSLERQRVQLQLQNRAHANNGSIAGRMDLKVCVVEWCQAQTRHAAEKKQWRDKGSAAISLPGCRSPLSNQMLSTLSSCDYIKCNYTLHAL